MFAKVAAARATAGSVPAGHLRQQINRRLHPIARRQFPAQLISSRANHEKEPKSLAQAARSRAASAERSPNAVKRPAALPWTRLSDEELLSLRFCDLKLTIDRSPLKRRVERLYTELEGRGIQVRPHVWLAEEWFSPDGVPGIAVPFYLAHPRLEKLERHIMREVEGG